MGSAVSIPSPDDRIKKAMMLSELSQRDVAKLWLQFSNMAVLTSNNDDNESTNANISPSSNAPQPQRNAYKNTPRISREAFFKEIDEPCSRYGDCIFELLEIDNFMKDGTLDFGEFVHSVVAMCLFEKEDILRYCFYVFDSNRNGYIDNDELDEMIDLLHNINMNISNDTESIDTNDDDDDDKNTTTRERKIKMEELKGDQKLARRLMEEQIDGMAIGGQLEFGEMKAFFDKFPRLFYPAFRIQNKIMTLYLGFQWWERKKQMLQDRKRSRSLLDNRIVQTNLLLERIRQRRIKREMGSILYYALPWKRKELNDIHPVTRMQPDTFPPTREELIAAEKKKRVEKKRLIKIQITNPETQAWKSFLQMKEQKSNQDDYNSSFTPEKQPASYLKRNSVKRREARITRRSKRKM